MRTRLLSIAVLSVLAVAAPPALARNQNQVRLDVTLTPSVDAPAEAIGDATHTQRRKGANFEVEVEDLPVGSYDVLVGGAIVGQVSVVSVAGGTQGNIEFNSRTQAGKLPLTFDPRGETIQIRSGSTVLLSGNFPGSPGTPSEDSSFNAVSQRLSDDTPGDDRGPRGSVLIQSNAKKAMLQFNLQRLDDSPHTITANDLAIATFTPNRGGKAKVRFSSKPKRQDKILDFDPADTTFRVMKGDDVVLEFVSGGQSIGGGVKPVGEIEQPFNNTGADPDASGRARLRERPGRFDFNVEIEDLPVGQYDLFVGGVKRATIGVTRKTGDDTEGEVEFSTKSEAGKLPFDFDPFTQTIQIRQGSTIFLSMTFPNG